MLVGEGYPTEAEATDAGTRWRGVLERALGACNVAVDFGDRRPRSGGLTPSIVIDEDAPDTLFSTDRTSPLADAALPQAATQLDDMLAQAHDDFDFPRDALTNADDPAIAIGTARRHLSAARAPAVELYRHVDAAHNQTAHITERSPRPPRWGIQRVAYHHYGVPSRAAHRPD